MKHIIVITLLLSACADDRGIPDPTGTSIYFIDNQTDATLGLSFTTSLALGAEENIGDPLAPQEVAEVFEDTAIGGFTLPLETFASLRLDIDGVVVYEQDPIDNSAWIVDQLDDNFSRAEITLEITEADLR